MVEQPPRRPAIVQAGRVYLDVSYAEKDQTPDPIPAQRRPAGAPPTIPPPAPTATAAVTSPVPDPPASGLESPVDDLQRRFVASNHGARCSGMCTVNRLTCTDGPGVHGGPDG